MNRPGKQRNVTILFYILVGYICLQFAWWAYLLIDLIVAHHGPEGREAVRIKVWMVVGEGAVFLVFLFAGLYIMQRAITREISMTRQQRNFLLSITHELKTPLAGIKLAIQTLQKRGNLSPEKRLEIETNALSNTERLHALIDNVLLATRIERGESTLVWEEVDLSVLTHEIAGNFGSEGELHMEVQPGITTDSDAHAYTSIVANLLDNALKYGGGRPVELGLDADTREVKLSVADRGAGIPPGEASRIFDMFYRSGNEETRKRKGTGLGLYIVRELATSLGGRVEAENRTGGGAVFRVSLPRKTAQ